MKKKVFAAGAVLLATAFIGQTVSAKTLEDVLKEKGVITEADYKEVTKVKPIDYKLGKGFTFTSADEKFQLSLGGRMQFRYTFTDYDSDWSPSKGDASQWNAQRIRLVLGGYAYTKDLTYKMEIDPRQLAQSSSDSTRGGLLDAYLNYKFMDEVQLLAGQTKVKYGYSMIQSDAQLMFVDRAPLIAKMTPSYEIGAFVYGQLFKGLMDYAVSTTNGDGQTNAASTNRNAVAARVQFSPLGKMANDEPDLAISKKPLLTVGANYFYTALGAGENSSTYGTTFNPPATPAGVKNELQNYGVDGHFKWMGLALQGEGLFTQSNPNANRKTVNTVGYYGQAGYMITPKIGVAFRYSVFDPNRDVSNDLQTEQIGCVSYYFDKHNLKLQADVANLHTQAAGGPYDDMQYRVQAQIIF